MTMILKLMAVLTTFATSCLLLFESGRRGALALGTVLGIVKIIVFTLFGVLMLVIAYVVLTTDEPRSNEDAEAESATRD